MTNLSAPFTCKVMQIARAPAKITLLGDKHRRPEPAQHVIEFPGGSIEVSRLTDNTGYWVHVSVNRDQAVDDIPGYHHTNAVITAARVDSAEGIFSIVKPALPTIEHIAFLIQKE